MANLQALAQQLDDAARAAKEIPQLTKSLTIDEAYEVQKQNIRDGSRVTRSELESRWASPAARRWCRWECTT